MSDNHQRLCLAMGFWNEKDRILKERLFGVTGHQGRSSSSVVTLSFRIQLTLVRVRTQVTMERTSRRFTTTSIPPPRIPT